MSINRYKPHVLVIPEEDANRQIANGFRLDDDLFMPAIQVLEEAGGWLETLQCFLTDHVSGLDKYPNRVVVLLIDFDGDEQRLPSTKEKVPERLRDRVFVLGVKTEPENLRRALGSYETIGRALARDCREGTNETWSHELLRCNADELARLRERVQPILFP